MTLFIHHFIRFCSQGWCTVKEFWCLVELLNVLTVWHVLLVVPAFLIGWAHIQKYSCSPRVWYLVYFDENTFGLLQLWHARAFIFLACCAGRGKQQPEISLCSQSSTAVMHKLRKNFNGASFDIFIAKLHDQTLL